MPLPDPRPSAKIAKLFPQVDPLKDQQKDQKSGVKPAVNPATSDAKDAAKVTEASKSAVATIAQPATAVPLPEARPYIKPVSQTRRQPRYHRYRHGL
jgi:membrane-bound lytic murein transglycosylase A